MKKKNPLSLFRVSLSLFRDARFPRRAPRARKGSALLIVLGMLAFMIVSAVAFAAYMRFSRLPSSYLRRSAASRQMVKAALARAIDQIDAAIGNNPHPGVGRTRTKYPRKTGSEDARNVWLHRVFFGGDEAAEVDETVPVLTLEGLAYIPPPLVNEARYYSRLSPCAAWKSLDFDVGRYAYCALDVSDYLDVNRLCANAPRSSAANRRVSLAYLFENDRHTAAGSSAANWDNTFMKKFRTLDEDTLAMTWGGSVAPLVSLADYNLALGKQGSVGDLKSPFYEYLRRSGGSGFYNTSSERDEDVIRRQTFITDSWFPEGEADGSDDNLIDLAEDQPFAQSLLAKQRPTLTEVLYASSLTTDFNWREHLSYAGCAALYDYLDPDHVPLSLAMPTVERVPMICGVQPVFSGLKVGVRRDWHAEGEGGATAAGVTVESGGVGQGQRVVSKTVHYRLALTGLSPANTLRVLTVYPFNHKEEDDGTAYTLDGRVMLFLSSADMTLRTSAGDVLHLADNNIPNTGLASGVLGARFEKNLSVRAVTDEESAVSMESVTLGGSTTALGSALALDGNELLCVTYRWTQTVGGGGNAGGLASNQWTPTAADAMADANNIVEAHCGLPALLANGTLDGDLSSDAATLSFVKGGGRKTLRLNLALQMRLRDADQNVVDMVPACLADDKTQNNVNNSADPRLSTIKTGDAYPVMRFDTAGQGACATLDFSLADLETAAQNGEETDVTLYPKTALVADPRYNYAPEYWYQHDGDLSKNAWLDNNHASDGDGDIFMATSDAGYLQSKYELAMLPRVTQLSNFGSSLQTGNIEQPSARASIPSAYGRNQNVNWRTYEPFGDDENAFEELPFVSGTAGFRVNPYSDATNVIMAAFANTPLDWKRASTNDVSSMGGSSRTPYYPEMDAAEFNKDYAWNQYNSRRYAQARLAWGDLQSLAGRFMKKVREQNGDWVEAWNDLGWNDDENTFGDLDLSASDDLHMVDRKFLYGYWRECFAARQQLFLVFVRAEPMMMGGGGMGQIPPQLGARAVALVWRSPGSVAEVNGVVPPHQTRVLFYRQLD